KEIAPEVYRLPVAVANAYFVGRPGQSWVLVDAGLPGYRDQIEAAAYDLYGGASRPEAIVLTHGHFDHAGSAHELADRWDVPVFAHPLERPYLEGKPYPPPDPTVGGPMALAMRLLPSQYSRVSLGDRLQDLPADDTLPFMPGWEWVF